MEFDLYKDIQKRTNGEIYIGVVGPVRTGTVSYTHLGQHGVATATGAALFDMECTVYMGKEDIQRQKLNVMRMEMLGAKVVSVESGSNTLKDATNEAIRTWAKTAEDTFYIIGSAVGPYPYPKMVKEFQSVISREAKRQHMEAEGKNPEDVYKRQLPVLLCFLSVGMLFLAEGKKTMLLPTLFTSLVLAELLIVLAVFPALYPFLLSGIYFFTLLHGVAWILILTGWITGGYRPPEKQGNEQIKREKNPKRSGHGWRRKKAHRRRKSKKKRSRKEDSSTKKKNTAGNKTFEWKHCQISYDPSKQTYRMISDSPEKILLLKEDNVIGTLEQGECVHVERPVTLQIQGKEERLHLK